MQFKPIRLLQEILRDHVAERPDKTALICEKTRLTYAQIDEMSNRLANAFAKNRVKDGDRIMFYLMNSAELVVSIFAALKANAVFSVVDYANTICVSPDRWNAIQYALAGIERTEIRR